MGRLRRRRGAYRNEQSSRSPLLFRSPASRSYRRRLQTSTRVSGGAAAGIPSCFRPSAWIRWPSGRSSGPARRTEPRAAARCRGGARPGLHPRGRRDGEDDDDHAPDRAPGRIRHVRPRPDHGGDVHRQGGRRAARAPRRAGPVRAGRHARPRRDVPLRRAAPAAPLRSRLGRPDPPVEGAAAPPARQPLARAVQVPAGGRPRRRDRVGEEPAHRPRARTSTRRRTASRRSPPT